MLKGAERMLREKRVHTIQFEYPTGWLARCVFLQDVFQFMEDNEYEVFKLFNGFLVPFHYTHREERFDSGRMIVCISNSRTDPIRIVSAPIIDSA